MKKARAEDGEMVWGGGDVLGDEVVVAWELCCGGHYFLDWWGGEGRVMGVGWLWLWWGPV